MDIADACFQRQSIKVGRRAFLRGGTLILAAGSISIHVLGSESISKPVRFGLMTDLHYADKPTAGSRHYRETLGKLEEATQVFSKEELGFIVELGDLIDAADSVETEMRYLGKVDQVFRAMNANRHYVLGNHCVDTLKKEEFLGQVGQEKSYYSFSEGGVHFIVLDACFRGDGEPYGRKNFQWTDTNIPSEELEWLRADLANSRLPVIVFAHQRLDVSDNHGVKNNAEVRKVLEASGRVLAVFQGHSHKNAYTEIGGIHYCTHVALVEGSGAENNAYSIVEVQSDGAIHVQGFRQQKSYDWLRG